MDKTNPERRVNKDKDHGLWSLFLSFFKVGLFTIGGGLAMIPYLERIVVEEKKWLAQEEWMDCLAVSQSLPGIVAVNMATYVGRRKAGFAGSLAATLGVILPSFFIILAVSGILLKVGDNRYLEGAFTGVKAAVCGMIGATVVRLGKKNLKDAFGWIIALCAFVSIGFLGVNAIFVVLAAALLGIAYYLLYGRKHAVAGEAATDAATEETDKKDSVTETADGKGEEK